MECSDDILGLDGLLSKAIPGFIPREAQQQMAAAIERAIAVDAQLIIEAGTGTGKTFGYLVPVFLAQKKTIISTGTRNLQDQLFLKDIPALKAIFTLPLKIVLLKGRANYLCHYRLQQNLQDGRFATRQQIAQLQEVDAWSRVTETGDIAELNTIAEDATIWPYVTSTTDNCLNQDCPFYQDCYVAKARQQALTADIVIVNHYLFFADLVLQEEGFGELLPGADVIIFDEAHHLPEIAAQFFSTTLTSRQLIELAKDTELAVMQGAKDHNDILLETDKLQQATHNMRAVMGDAARRKPWPEQCSPLLMQHIQQIKASLKILEELLKIAAIRSESLENCWRRTIVTIERFNQLTSEPPEDTIHWYETFTQSFALQLTPIGIANHFKRYLAQKKKSWIFTSATLAVKNSFRLFIDAMGLDDALQLQLKSPFDYAKQALLYVPRNIPDPQESHYTEAVLKAALPVIELMQGKTFLLFTSYRALDFAADYLRQYTSLPLLVQGTMPKRNLIENFLALQGQAILLGTSSFWYGVDVRGEALSCVIIDKLPFAAPDDPILQAKIRKMRKNGEDPFVNIQLPQAVLMLKQGAGRLIRDVTDRGVLMICDPRMVGAQYGQVFLQSLPAMTRTREFETVKNFLCEKPEVCQTY